MGRVFLVGAGPGDPELLTCKALRVLRSASVVLHDSLVSESILSLIPENAERIDVGKRRGYRLLSQDDSNSLLVSSAATHEIVVRLKGGDPLLFGRAAEEIRALREAGIEFEIVPGISAAFGAAASARVPLTDRALASSVLFTTFSRAPEAQYLLRSSLSADTTVVVYMPGTGYPELSNWLLEAGLSAETPCLVISKATQPDQATERTTAAALADLPPLPAPALLLVGRAVAPDYVVLATVNWAASISTEKSVPLARAGFQGVSPSRNPGPLRDKATTDQANFKSRRPQ